MIQSKVLLLLVLYLMVLLPVGAAVKKPQIDYDALERAWEAGDAREELRSPGDEQFEALSEKSEQEAKELGAQMVFITLRKDRASPLEPLADVASRWKEVVLSMTYLSSLSFRLTLVLVRVAFAAQALWNGGLEVTVYEIEEGKKLLVGLQRGIQIADLRKFLSEQPDVLEFEWNSEMYVNDNKQQQQKKGRKARKKEKRAATKSSKKKRKHATHTSSMQEPRSEL